MLMNWFAGGLETALSGGIRFSRQPDRILTVAAVRIAHDVSHSRFQLLFQRRLRRIEVENLRGASKGSAVRRFFHTKSPGTEILACETFSGS